MTEKFWSYRFITGSTKQSGVQKDRESIKNKSIKEDNHWKKKWKKGEKLIIVLMLQLLLLQIIKFAELRFHSEPRSVMWTVNKKSLSRRNKDLFM